ncbi:hypothetical protein N783_19035 [Pontibacillus marinus BH030004 = DSM 16465]|uniref:Uncharacterized protein n=1 Tax=Pontibacillus marinus BH030004 = DSM 16465 TaxID=1385511 RepID=A0A0A5FW35_9BACI|nr:hypothetical protein N783_19035 [Pontibacillus marinus BH030004 = DSM 16465]
MLQPESIGENVLLKFLLVSGGNTVLFMFSSLYMGKKGSVHQRYYNNSLSFL